MKTLMERLYNNINEAKAFAISFTNFIYDYDNVLIDDYFVTLCDHCGKMIQQKDYLAPKANCKSPCGILTTCNFGISIDLKNELIENFDITEKDFRPIRTKKGEIVYYQITPQHVMLPINKENRFRVSKPCAYCGSFFYNDKPYENENGEDYFYISQQALNDMHDINITYEKFSRFYVPMFVISRRVYDFLVERYPRSHFFPFFLQNNTQCHGDSSPNRKNSK